MLCSYHLLPGMPRALHPPPQALPPRPLELVTCESKELSLISSTVSNVENFEVARKIVFDSLHSLFANEKK